MTHYIYHFISFHATKCTHTFNPFLKLNESTLTRCLVNCWYEENCSSLVKEYRPSEVMPFVHAERRVGVVFRVNIMFQEELFVAFGISGHVFFQRVDAIPERVV